MHCTFGEFEGQGFDVAAAFEPLSLQKDGLADFEEDIFNRLRRIIDMCNQKANSF